MAMYIRYDGHRDAILRGDDRPGSKDSSAGTTAEDLMRYFSMSEFRGFGDDDKVSNMKIRRLHELEHVLLGLLCSISQAVSET